MYPETVVGTEGGQRIMHYGSFQPVATNIFTTIEYICEISGEFDVGQQKVKLSKA